MKQTRFVFTRRPLEQCWLVRLQMLAIWLPSALSCPAAPDALAPELREKVDAEAMQLLVAAAVPGFSIAIVRDGQVAFRHAYGDARLNPRVPASSEMRFSIGSISKQFTATAILMLAEQGKLSLEDPVSRFLPDLAQAHEVKIRQLLSHTAGYQDYWPQDYVTPFLLQPTSVEQLLGKWAQRPLDFAPGTDWQYSNTGYVIAGRIVELASGQKLIEFLRQNIFVPLKMETVFNINEGPLPPTDSAGYLRYGLGPLRPAPKEAKGWLFAAGQLAMTAEDLAKWDIGLINQTLLKPASYREMESAVILKNGLAKNYGLGVSVERALSRRLLAHSGAVSGFSAYNMVFPDDRVAVVVLSNADSSTAPESLGLKIARLLFSREDPSKEEEQARKIFEDLQQGKLDRRLFSGNANFYFSDLALRDLATSLQGLGKPKSVTRTSTGERGGMTFHRFEVHCARRTVQVWQRTLPDGKIEQYQVMGAAD